MSIKPTRFDPDAWIMGNDGGYNYIGMHTHYVLVVAVNPTSTFTKLKKTYIIKAFGPPIFHLGYDYSQVNKGAAT